MVGYSSILEVLLNYTTLTHYLQMVYSIYLILWFAVAISVNGDLNGRIWIAISLKSSETLQDPGAEGHISK